jgi:serine/threonine protein phosphatase 1
MNKKVYCIGDIHGRLSALNQVLELAGFDNNSDRLITLGDVCDGGSQTKKVIERLLDIEDRIDILGNHDIWFRQWAMWRPENAYIPPEQSHWENQGGLWTMRSYGFEPLGVPFSHRDFLLNQVPYHIDDKNRIFVHGGFNPRRPVEFQEVDKLVWDRRMAKRAQYHRIRGYRHVFLGHTSTMLFKENGTHITHPITHYNLTLCDCGAGGTGRLALVNVENPKEYWLSDPQELQYEPGENDGSEDTEESPFTYIRSDQT